jgi:xanthine dehydrogenase accessory factor
MAHDTLAQAGPKDPITAVINDRGDAVLAIIAGVEGPSYRPIGAMMAVFAGGDCVGTLSSGCIERDIALHATRLQRTDPPLLLRYGRGSPFIDIQLPCGGGLDVLLVPLGDRRALVDVAENHARRVATTLLIDMQTGQMETADTGATGRTGHTLRVRIQPALQFHVFGKGPEAVAFAALASSINYPTLLMSPDHDTLRDGRDAGCPVSDLTSLSMPQDLNTDARTAIVLFFHDHDWEPPLLADALATPAFYIGAQGSQRARDARLLALRAMGQSPQALARLHGPIGIIPSARDPGTLAVSVLAQVLACAMDV